MAVVREREGSIITADQQNSELDNLRKQLESKDVLINDLGREIEGYKFQHKYFLEEIIKNENTPEQLRLEALKELCSFVNRIVERRFAS